MKHSNQSLYQLTTFWLAILIPLIIAALVAVWIAWHSLHVDGFLACWSASCINQALGMMKLPITIAALAFPLAALVASHHRSVQTAEQINQAIINNTFSNYYKHVEHFESRYKNIEIDLQLDKHYIVEFEFSSLSNLYISVFPFNFPHDFSPGYRGDYQSGLEKAIALLQVIFHKPINFKKTDSNCLNLTHSQNLFSSLSIRSATIQHDKTYNLTPKDSSDMEWNNPKTNTVLIIACMKLVFSLNKFSSSKIPMSYETSSRTGLATIDFKGQDFSKSLN
ncbi:hypothetical protein V6259_01365 [Marinomonas sp. TI.3.20]|uniref:hypothetical protein n=1 Tax=Marinomonas sp. TI.3.20 TaxID=3121296 RepID=UPI00311E386A